MSLLELVVEIPTAIVETLLSDTDFDSEDGDGTDDSTGGEAGHRKK